MEQNNTQLEKLRHSLSHLMAYSVREIYGQDVKFAIGPTIENGFYYDMELPEKISEKDLARIETKMRKFIDQKLPITSFTTSRENALAKAKSADQPFKQELIEDLPPDETISYYQIGDFIDLCRGPHLKNTSEISKDSFKLTKIAGAYWRGDEKREMLTRIYGVAFTNKADLDTYLARQEESKLRDHRKLGRELDLFTFSDLVGAGLPMFTPRGTILRDLLANYSLSLRQKAGFGRVFTPHITKMDLYKTSGHYEKFGAELFLVESQVNGETFALKPMNCPHHTQIFAANPHTYKELPIRYMEPTTDYRDEKTGELGGLNRVRALTQDDSHVFCTQEQIKSEVKTLVDIVKELYTTFNMSNLRARLSYRDDSDQYLGDHRLWQAAEAQIKEIAIENHIDFFEMKGEAAFYGPKIDFMAKDALEREHQVATIQLDFVMPTRFELEYINEKGEKSTPVMIHHATLGSIERFMSVFIEHTAGHFPFWCAPEQIRILTVNDQVDDYVTKVTEVLDQIVLEQPLADNHLRYTLNKRNDSLGKKIKEASNMKIPVTIIVGPKDAENQEISIRLQDKEEKIPLQNLEKYLLSL